MSNYVLGGLLALVMAASVYPLSLFANLTSASDTLAISTKDECSQVTETAIKLKASGQCDLAERILAEGSTTDPTLRPDLSVALPPTTVPIFGQPYTVPPKEQPGSIVALPAEPAPQTVSPDPVVPGPVVDPAPVPTRPEPVEPPTAEPEPTTPTEEPTTEPEPTEEPTTEPEPSEEPTPSEDDNDNGSVTEDLSDTVKDTVDNVGDVLS